MERQQVATRLPLAQLVTLTNGLHPFCAIRACIALLPLIWEGRRAWPTKLVDNMTLNALGLRKLERVIWQGRRALPTEYVDKR